MLRHTSRFPFWARTAKANGGHRFVCDLRDSISREVCFTGCYEPQETALLRKLLSTGMTLVDVGANWGYFSLLGAHLVGASGRVISLEPHPRLFRRLRENAESNGLRQVLAVEAAAANEAGVLTLEGFREHDENWGLSRIVNEEPSNGHEFQVAAVRLDTLLDREHVNQVHLLKMDIEGAEESALQGMLEGLANGRYLRIVLELHPELLTDRGSSVGEVLALLSCHGYRGWWIDHSRSATRRAAYTGSLDIREYLKPVTDPEQSLNDWPHMLWLAPGEELAF